MKYTYTYASHATLKNLACQMQVNKSNENYYLSNDTVMLLMTGHQSNHTTGGPAQAKLGCYDGWLRRQICTEEKVTL
jgi:hypothetical protein